MVYVARKPAVSFYSLGQEVTRFLVGAAEEQFYVHDTFLGAHNYPRTHDVNMRLDNTKENNAYICYSDIEPRLFRGFLEWIYRSKLPTKETIKSKPHPTEWEQHSETKLLVCSMAMELYFLGDTLEMPPLQHKAMPYIYDAYRTTLIVPSPARIEHIEDALENYGDLWRLCVDCYVMWYGKDATREGFWDAYTNLDALPDGFVDEVSERSTEVKSFVAGSKIA